MHAPLTFIACTLNDVIQMRNDARGEERLAEIVEVDAPRVACAMREHFESVPRWMVSPDGGINALAVFVRGSRLANSRMRKHAMTTIQPAVRPPNERVERLMCVLISPAIQQDLR